MPTSLTRAVFCLLLLSAPAPTCAQPDGYQGRWSLSFEGGVDGLNGGTVHRAGTGEAADLSIAVERRGFPELYDHGWRFGVGFGYGVAEKVEVIGRLSVGGVNAQNEPVGTVRGLGLLALFDDYRDVALEGGIRYHFATGVPLEPHVNVLLGVRRVQAIAASFTIPGGDPAGNGLAFRDVPFFDASIVPGAGADFGLSYYANPRTAIGFEVGIRYQRGLRDIDGTLAPIGLAGINDAGDRWSIPFSGVLRVYF